MLNPLLSHLFIYSISENYLSNYNMPSIGKQGKNKRLKRHGPIQEEKEILNNFMCLKISKL